MSVARTHILARLSGWLRATRGAACARTLLSAILLLACGVDLGLPWVSLAIENNEVCPCCHRKGAACCRRMHHDGPSWQDRSCCGPNCSVTRATLSANAIWVAPGEAPFSLIPSGRAVPPAGSVSPVRVHECSLRQRPPPVHWS